MKFFLLIMMTTLMCFGQFKFDNIKKADDYFGVFHLTHSLSKNKKAVLDCQSFFHKFDIFFKDTLVSENYISEQECYDLYMKTTSCLKKKTEICLSAENLYQRSCDCP